MLVIDSTSSMGWIHQYLRNHLSKMISDFQLEGRTIDFAIMGFRDTKCSKYPWLEISGWKSPSSNLDMVGFPWAKSTKLKYSETGHSNPVYARIARNSAFRDDSTSPEKALELLRSKGGGNNSAESSLFALRASLEVEWPADSRRKIIVLFTDEKPHIPDLLVPTWKSFNNEISNPDRLNKIDQIHLFITPDKQEYYEELTFSGIQILFHNLTKDLNNLDRSFRNFVQSSSEWDEDDDDEIIYGDWSEGENPFDD
jgi:hypothetical protein